CPGYVKFNVLITTLPDWVWTDPKYSLFKNCLGALNRVMVPVCVPSNVQASWKS
ncbi:hypothetical protein VP01_13013g1, partial [Puccinia sorghi]